MRYVVKKFEELTNREVYEMLQLRFNVFVLEQHCFYEEIDGKDELCMHLLALDGDKLVGYLRIIPASVSFNEASIGRFVVAEKMRKSGIGKTLFAEAIRYIEEVWKEKAIRIEAQSYLKSFYMEFGFVPVSEEFLDEGVPHYVMLKVSEG